jgi:hypothetical protein
MNSLILSILLTISTNCFSQSKSDSLINKIEYRVSSTNSDAKLIINYRDEKEQFLGSSGQSGWIYSFNTAKNPFTALLSVNLYPTRITKTTVTLTILVYGVVVQEKTGVIRLDHEQQIQYVVKQ